MLKNILDKVSTVFLTIAGLEWGYMLIVSFIDPDNTGDLDDVLIYSRHHEWLVWCLRSLHFIIALSAFYTIYRLYSDARARKLARTTLMTLAGMFFLSATLISGFVSVPITYAQLNHENAPHACPKPGDCETPAGPLNSKDDLTSQSAPHVNPSDSAVKGKTDCYATYEEYIDAPSSMGSFDKPLCAGVSATSKAPSKSTATANTDTQNKIIDLTEVDSKFSSSVRLPPGTQTTYDLFSLQEQLKDGQIIVHIPDRDKMGQSQYAIVEKSQVQAFENYYSQFDSSNNNMLANSDSTLLRLIGSALADTGITSYFQNLNTKDLPEFVQASGANYDSFNKISDYASSLQGKSEENIKGIYDKLQQTVNQNQFDANGYSMAESLETGIAVCRQGAAILSTVLANSGYDSSMVINGNHAWVRVDFKGKTFDLDPNGYQTFVELPPRGTSNSFQIIPIQPKKPKPQGFLWPFIPTAYAATQNASQASATSSTSQTGSVNFCGKIGICLDIDMPAVVHTNSTSTLEVWQSQGNDWTITTLFINPDVNLDFSNLESSKINLYGHMVDAKEHVVTPDKGKTTYLLYSQFSQANNDKIIVQVISNKPILQNQSLLTMLTGGKKVVESTPQPTTPVAPIQHNFIAENATVLLSIIIGLIVIMCIVLIVLLKKRGSNPVLITPPTSQ